MSWTPFLIILALFKGSLSQPVLTQPPSASSSLGKLVTLTCSLNSGYMKNNVDWYQQSFKKTVQFLMRVGQNGNVISKGDSIPDRFSGSGSGLFRYLNIQNVQDEDENVYFCGSDLGSGSNYVYVFGSGTKLSVLGQPKSTPKITVFPPSPEELQTNKATLVCLINDFYPSAVTVAWKTNGAPTTDGVATVKPSKEGKKYVASSFLSLTPEQWKSNNLFTCQVTHEGDIVEKSVSSAECL